MIQYLPCIVEYPALRGATDNLLQRHPLILRPGNEIVQIIHVGLQMLPMMESERLVADYRCQRCVRKFNECKHI